MRVNIAVEFVPLLGYIPILEWEQSGGEIMTAVVEIAHRLLERGGAGAGPGLIVRCVKWRGREVQAQVPAPTES